ncbi:MAG: hypothetical protein EOP59_00410 [Sphingomonadales bacterium]|nr:MAG: hypothetical protein EOP59_00410 [Sphingomonadales bacterium]
MPVYHFHVVDEGTMSTPEVCEFANLSVARAEAVRLFGGLVRDRPNIRHDDELCVRVTDDCGLALFDLTLIVTEAPVLRAPIQPIA